MSTASSSSSSGIGFTGLLTVAFVVLKLTHQIDWAWVWVLAPLWMGFGVFVLIMLLALAAFVVTSLLDRKAVKVRR